MKKFMAFLVVAASLALAAGSLRRRRLGSALGWVASKRGHPRVVEGRRDAPSGAGCGSYTRARRGAPELRIRSPPAVLGICSPDGAATTIERSPSSVARHAS